MYPKEAIRLKSLMTPLLVKLLQAFLFREEGSD